MIKNLIICLAVLTLHLLPGWYEDPTSAIIIKSLYLKKEKKIPIFVDFKDNRGEYVAVFMSLNTPIKNIIYITNAIPIFITKEKQFIYKYTPKITGSYYFSAVLVSVKKDYQKYLFITSKYGVPIKIESKTNFKNTKTSKSNTNLNLITKTGDSLVSTNKIMTSAKTNEIKKQNIEKKKKANIERIGNIISEIRDLNLDMREKYFLKDTYTDIDIYKFLLRYIDINNTIDSFYQLIILDKSNWQYMVKINKEYLLLSKTFNDVVKKMILSVKEND